MNINKFKHFNINEGIDRDNLNKEQRESLKELKNSDVSLFNGDDFQFYADEIGVQIKDIMEFVADGGTYTPEVDQTYDADIEYIEDAIQKELVDDTTVNSGNLTLRAEDLLDELEDKEPILQVGTSDILNVEYIIGVYRRLIGEDNPNQTEIKFESKVFTFNEFSNK